MTLHRFISRTAAPASFASCLLLGSVSGCIAPPKSVGEQESDSDTEGSASDSDSATASASDTSQVTDTSGETDSDTGPIASCNELADQGSCEGPDPTDDDWPCAWVEVETIEHSPDTCGFFNAPQGRCIGRETIGDGGCEPGCLDESGQGVFIRSLGSGQVEAFAAQACGFLYDGFTACALENAEPGCHCMCSSGPEALPPGFEEEITEQGGCADMALHASNPADSLGLSLFIDEAYVEQVVQSGQSLDVQVDAAAFTRFELRLGTNVTADECNDVLGNGVVIDTVWEPVSGTVDIHLEPEMSLARATVTLTDVTLEVTQGIAAEAHISSYVFDDVQVGWLPG